MKNQIIALFMFLPFLALAQSGTVFDELTMESDILKMERKYAIYLPPDYETSHRSYPVLYLLHGGGDDQTGWVQFGEVLHIADHAINTGNATAMIIVMPDANTGMRGYSNNLTGQWDYEDFFFDELMPYVEKTYRIKSQKRYRAVAGLSMGGGGTYYYALHRPDLFSSACPLSAGAKKGDLEVAKAYLERQGITDVTEKQIMDWIEKYDILGMIEHMPDEQKEEVRWYIDSGDDDSRASEGAGLVHAAMNQKGIPHEFRIRDGKHNWTYWRQSLPKVLNYISIGFHQGTD